VLRASGFYGDHDCYEYSYQLAHAPRVVTLRGTMRCTGCPELRARFRCVIVRRGKRHTGYYWKAEWTIFAWTPERGQLFEIDVGGLLDELDLARMVEKAVVFMPLKSHEMLENLAGSR